MIAQRGGISDNLVMLCNFCISFAVLPDSRLQWNYMVKLRGLVILIRTRHKIIRSSVCARNEVSLNDFVALDLILLLILCRFIFGLMNDLILSSLIVGIILPCCTLYMD